MPRSYNSTEYLAAVVFSGMEKGRRMIFMAPYAPYIDESGTHAGSAVTCLAGYVSTNEKWGAFTSEWNDILKDLIPWQSPAENYFHMSKFAGNFGPYRNFQKHPREKAEFAGRILKAITRTREFGFCTAVLTRDYDALVRTPRLRQMFGTAYTFCVQTCLGWVANWASETEAQTHTQIAPMIYSFEKGAPHEAEADSFLRLIANSQEDREGYRYHDHIFLDKRGTPPLQAADVFACEVYRQMASELTGVSRKGNYYLADLVEQGRDKYVVFNRERLRKTLARNALRHFRQMADEASKLMDDGENGRTSEDSFSQ